MAHRTLLIGVVVWLSLLACTAFATAAEAQPTPALGNQTVESTQDDNPAGMAEAFEYTATTTAATSDAQVYVDSGSTDGSAEVARALGVDVLILDKQLPFTAARARNEGFRRLNELAPGLRYVQFIDGDCEIVTGWLDKSRVFLDQHPDVAVVYGRRRERYPQRSIYNMLCDIEWDTPVGEAKACGGDALARVEAFAAVNGYRTDLIAGEEPELCVRLRAAGWRIWRLDAEMTLHDAAMLRFSQWWKRNLRSGHAFAQGALLYGTAPERHRVREALSAWLWALGLPLAVSVFAFLVGPLALVGLAAYPLQVVRLALHGQRSARENWWRAFFLVLGKFPELLGQMKFLAGHCLRAPSQLIEYK